MISHIDRFTKSTLLRVFSFKCWNKTPKWYSIPILQMRKTGAEKGLTCPSRSSALWQSHTFSLLFYRSVFLPLATLSPREEACRQRGEGRALGGGNGQSKVSVAEMVL